MPSGSKRSIAKEARCKAKTENTTLMDAAASTGGNGAHHCDMPLISRKGVVQAVRFFICSAIILYAVYRAYSIRLLSVHIYGRIIHEFDPWFNYRATEYLSDHGWDAFFKWYDYMSWYPLGRPVGTTIYPGMQITSVAIHRMLGMVGWNMSLNDVCVFVPAWFGSIATILTALLAYECSGSLTVSAITAYFFAIIPAHLMRSMAGEYDNECIAMTAMLLTFYMWVRSLRTARSWPIGVLTGLAYGYMVSTWGGYIFVLNMVALHAVVCVFVDWVRNTYDVSILKAYSLFFVVGTAIATRVPPVGWSPFRSLEQLMALVVFIFMWALHFSEILRRRAGAPIRSVETLRVRARVFLATLAALVAISVMMLPSGYFGPLSSRVRALFLQHTRTGNPLVDSVAEHQPATAGALWNFLHICCPFWALGMLLMMIGGGGLVGRASSFQIVYSVVAWYFGTRMSRLLLLTGPAATTFSGFFIGSILDWAMHQFVWETGEGVEEVGVSASSVTRRSMNDKVVKAKESTVRSNETFVAAEFGKFVRSWPRGIRLGIAVLLFASIFANPLRSSLEVHSERMANAFSNPLLILLSENSQGETVFVDDYYVSYLWLRDNTPEDARVLAWWDYGYQITGIGNRTTLADGNTWNHGHIATIGKMLTSPVKEAHSLIRHLADYVLIWSGQMADDLMKSAHMARIGNSVYRDICPLKDPLCNNFGFLQNDIMKPTPMMRRSLLYNMHGQGELAGVGVDRRLFRLAYKSRYGLVKIYKVMNIRAESKAWVADPKNRKCDPPGSWLCAGQYPPAKEIRDLIAKRIEYR